MKPSRPRHVAVVRSPKDFQPCVDTLHSRPTFVAPLEFLGRARNRREPSQVRLTRDARRQASRQGAVAFLVTGTIPAFMPRGAAIFHTVAIVFITDVGHAM